MKQPRTKIARLIADRTLKDGASKRFVREIAAYLLSERRASELDSVLRDVQDDWARAGQVEVAARCAYSLTKEAKAEITARVKQLYPEAKRIIIDEIRDPAVIGGVRLNLPGRQLDLTVQTKLHTFKERANRGKD